ncbi:unnamed protein product, partial [marine sediment metagenome]
GCHIETIVCTPSEIEQVIGDYYSVTEVSDSKEAGAKEIEKVFNCSGNSLHKQIVFNVFPWI